jgi:hypothetical protein
MKKIFTSISLIIATVFSGSAQNDTLLFENFQGDSIDYILTGFPTEDNLWPDWVNYDLDGLADQSGSDRPDEWFLALAWAEQDTNYMPLMYSDSDNVVIASNSWTLDAANPVLNYLVLPKIFISDDQAVLRWKSAPFQTPRYVDGYHVLVSVGGNEDYEFTDTLATFAEFLDATDLEDTNTYTFSEGIRHTLVEIDPADITRQRGVLQEWEVSLADYEGMSIHVCFLHRCFDDNLIGLDDILVLGTGNVGINDKPANEITLALNPNPAKDIMQVNYYLNKTAPVTSYVYDINGKLIESKNRGMQLAGNQQFSYNTTNLEAGSYFFTLDTGKEKITQQFVVVK